MAGSRHTYRILVLLAIFFAAGCTKVEVSPVSNPSSSILKFYGDQYGNYLSSFQATSDGGYMFGGYTINSFSLEQQGFIQKCDKQGNIEWYKTYGGAKQDLFWVVRQTTDGGYIACGATTSYGLGATVNYNLQNAYLVKTDSRGTLMWQRNFGGKTGALFYDVTETPDHGFVATGSEGGQFYLVKTNQNGDSLWTRTLFKGYSRSYGASVITGPDGNIAVAGFEQNKDTFGGYASLSILTQSGTFLIHSVNFSALSLIFPGSGGALFNSYNVNNPSQAAFSINLTQPLNCEKIISRPDGYIYAMNLQGFKSILLFKADIKGNMKWYRQYTGKNGSVFFSDVTNEADGGLLVSGGTFGFDPSDPYFYTWLLRTDAEGQKINESFIPITENSWAQGAVASGSHIAVGLNLTTPSNIHANYFGFLITDKDGKIK